MGISFDDFKKLDLRVGTITQVEDHPNADKLYLITVSLGTEVRTLVAGLKNYYTPELLQGKQIVVVANLEPVEVRGIISDGMLLAAQSDGAVRIISPEKPIDNGAKIF